MVQNKNNNIGLWGYQNLNPTPTYTQRYTPKRHKNKGRG